MSPLRWTSKSIRALTGALRDRGHTVSDIVTRRLLRERGYSLQANAKTTEGGQHPDRDAQFAYLNDQATDHLAAGDPVISVDTKKKELVGAYKNNGREWQPKGEPEQVKVHDFIDTELGKANPYGVYDVGTNTGWVSVGTDHDTAAFAVNTIATWWQQVGKTLHPNATRLMISADGGGSNGYRTRQWKTELAEFAAATGLTVTVCHLPPGTSNRVGDWRGDAVRAFRFQPPPPRSVRAVLPHTAHRRRSPPAFGFSRQSRKGLGATTFPERLTRPRWPGEA
jgi:hypothetical protein